ncbi:phage integrase family protein [Polaromonas sp.]|uniref:phage integrase family protein n=1 Tax=Polaromonas sp. TaxID=1869339 RepID=UPI00352AE824
MTAAQRPQPLQRRHFAFMRAVLQGLDARASWDRYLRSEGELSDLRAVKRSIDWIRDAFATAARRANRPGTARLVVMDPDRMPSAAALPSLEEFAAAHGLEDFSEEEQALAFLEAHPEAAGGRQKGRLPQRARLIARQLEALHWLESMASQEPRPDDSVEAWLNPAVALRLRLASLTTLRSVTEAINREGDRWWRKVPGVGPLKAARVVRWLLDQGPIDGLVIGRHALAPRRRVPAEILATVVPPSAAMVPFEKLRLPPSLDGSQGSNRAPAAECRIAADNDHEAVSAWLASKAARPKGGLATGPSGSLSATQRAYRKEAERLLLWCALECGKPLSSLTAADAMVYGAFLGNPPSHWCGPRHHQRWSSRWRPLEAALSPAALRHSVQVLRALFTYLTAHRYVCLDPFRTVPLPTRVATPLGAGRGFSEAQWMTVQGSLAGEGSPQAMQRLSRAIRWLYATGLRLSELTSARCAQLEPIEAGPVAGGQPQGWVLRIPGTRHSRNVPVPTALVVELEQQLGSWGRVPSVRDAANADVAILACPDTSAARRVTAWSASGLSKALRLLMAQLQAQSQGADAERFARASAHWLRHTHGQHTLNGKAGVVPVPIRHVQHAMGHASLRTTRGYLAKADTGGAVVL